MERGLALRWNKVVPLSVEKALEDFQAGQDVSILKQICLLKPSALSRLLLVAAEHLNWPKAENEGAVQTHARHEIVQIERGGLLSSKSSLVSRRCSDGGPIHGLITLLQEWHRRNERNAARWRKDHRCPEYNFDGFADRHPFPIASYYQKVEILRDRDGDTL